MVAVYSIFFSSIYKFNIFNFPGESGLGKSTLINSLFLTNLYSDREIPPVSGMFVML